MTQAKVPPWLAQAKSWEVSPRRESGKVITTPKRVGKVTPHQKKSWEAAAETQGGVRGSMRLRSANNRLRYLEYTYPYTYP